MGAEFQVHHGYVDARAEVLRADITLPFPSVGATENLLTAAVVAKGTTVIDNAARSPRSPTCATCSWRWGPRSRASAPRS
ncbi:MAG: hypothetical protein R2705_12245 [Ilumatobacteraceae bacterium]